MMVMVSGRSRGGALGQESAGKGGLALVHGEVQVRRCRGVGVNMMMVPGIAVLAQT